MLGGQHTLSSALTASTSYTHSQAAHVLDTYRVGKKKDYSICISNSNTLTVPVSVEVNLPQDSLVFLQWISHKKYYFIKDKWKTAIFTSSQFQSFGLTLMVVNKISATIYIPLIYTHPMEAILTTEVKRVESLWRPRAEPPVIEATTCTPSNPTHSKFWS